MRSARTLSPAKINLGLEILGKRPDGFHEIRTVMQAISLADEIIVSPAACNRLSSTDRALEYDGNLALRAARIWSDEVDPQRRNLAIEMRKTIPVAAGLGGASSNGATVLALANALFEADVTEEDLHAKAASLGSDVPFFLGATAAIASGRGEILAPLPALRDAWFVLATPDVEIPRKTAAMYGRLTQSDFGDGSIAEALAGNLRRGESLEPAHLANAFERPLLDYLPELEVIPSIMRSFGGQRVGLSGAGPTWYAVVGSLFEANGLAEALREQLPSARVETARALEHRPAIELLDDRNDPGASRV